MKVCMPSREEIHIAYEQGEVAVVELIMGLGMQLEKLAMQLSEQAAAIQELKARLEKDSSNSSKPPSSDGYGKKNSDEKRTESLRKSGQKTNGGQHGHKGNTLDQSKTPDHIEVTKVDACAHCGAPLADEDVSGYEERQVFDIPAIRIEITSFKVEIKICPQCNRENRGQFSDDVTQPTQYGNGVKTWASYFPNQHYVSVERTAQIFEDLLKHRVSEATILKASETLNNHIAPSTEATKELLKKSDIINLDESGLRVKGKLHWLHVVSNKLLTYYQVHAKRGLEAMNHADVIPRFSGIAVHDHWKPYFNYDRFQHALCNAHHLRELLYIEKKYEQDWAKDMSVLLLQINDMVEKFRADGVNLLPVKQLEIFERSYDVIVAKGYESNPHPPPDENQENTKKRGRKKQTTAQNLLDRLHDYKSATLLFMYDFQVPFTNNLAEQDVRMIKVKQKVSGCFRTFEGSERFVNIRGYISTARKNELNAYDVISDAFNGKPFIPSLSA